MFILLLIHILMFVLCRYSFNFVMYCNLDLFLFAKELVEMAT